MLILMECAMYQEIKRASFTATKIILGIFILMYFGASLVNCDEDIRFCKESLKELKNDLKDWKVRCLDNTLEFSRDINTRCCNTEKKYIQIRRKMQRKLCFYKGNHFIIIFVARAVARTLIGGGGCIFIYSCFARQISFQIDQFEFDLKRNSSGRT